MPRFAAGRNRLTEARARILRRVPACPLWPNSPVGRLCSSVHAPAPLPELRYGDSQVSALLRSLWATNGHWEAVVHGHRTRPDECIRQPRAQSVGLLVGIVDATRPGRARIRRRKASSPLWPVRHVGGAGWSDAPGGQLVRVPSLVTRRPTVRTNKPPATPLQPFVACATATAGWRLRSLVSRRRTDASRTH